MFLDEIVATVRRRLEEKKSLIPAAEIQRRLSHEPEIRDFAAALEKAGFGVIAEIKKASPAKGWLQEELDIVGQAKLYEQGGARAVSVLTEPDFFRGSPEDLKTVRQAISLPVLRKDFILDAYQLYEARLYGADAILLIASIMSPDTLKDLLELAYHLKMAALVEVHNAQELDTALQKGARIIGINNRNLVDFTVDLKTTLELRQLIPPGVLVISESGISNREDAARLRAAGVNGILVGEALVKASNPVEKIRELLSE